MFLSFFVALGAAWALPQADFILSRMTQKSGHGNYRIIQEVTFQSGDQSAVIKETWSIRDGTTYLLEARGRGFSRTILYKGGQKTSSSSNGLLKTAVLPMDFTENLFLARDSNVLRRELSAHKFLPYNIPQPNKFKTVKDIKRVHQPWVNLARSRGTVTFVMSADDNFNESARAPAIWVEQDRFVIRRIRLADFAEIVADEVTEFSQGLTLPKSRKINWNNNSVQVEIVRADSVKFRDDIFGASFLKGNSERASVSANTSLASLIDEFYSRFR